jgi:hydrogenase-4 component F
MYMQRDIKRLLAYSSTENIGLIVLALGIGGPAGVFAGLLQAVNHSLVKSLMFCVSGNILIKYGSRSLDQVKGMLQAVPASGVLLTVGALALAGAPPFNIFLSKFFIITTGLGAGLGWLMIASLLLLTVIFAALLRVVGSAVFGRKPEALPAGEFNWLTLLPVAALAVLVLTLGLYLPPQLLNLLNGAGSLVLAGEPSQTLALVTMQDILTPLAGLWP